MSHKNYSKFSGNSKNQNGVKTDKVSFEEVTEFEELASEEVVNLNEEDVAEVSTNGNLTGVVTGCSKLNVRKEPSTNSDPVCIIEKDAEVMVYDAESTTEDFYKVCTSSGVEGYCMKKFISIK